MIWIHLIVIKLDPRHVLMIIIVIILKIDSIFDKVIFDVVWIEILEFSNNTCWMLPT